MEGAWESGRQNHPIDSASLATSGPAPEPLLHLSLLFQFKRLQGKRNRGREEINFVEIKGDDQLSGAQQWMTKSLTEEKTMKSFSRVSGAGLLGSQCGRPRSPLALPPAAAPWQTPVVRWQCAPGSGTGSAVSPGRGRPAAEAGQQRSVPPRQVSGASWLLPGQPAVALPPRRPVRLGPRSARLWGAGAMEPQRSWGPGFWACSPSVPSFLGAGGPARSPASSGRDGEPLCT